MGVHHFMGILTLISGISITVLQQFSVVRALSEMI